MSKVSKSSLARLKHYYDLMNVLLVYIRDPEDMKRIYEYVRGILCLQIEKNTGDNPDQIIRPVKLERTL